MVYTKELLDEKSFSDLREIFIDLGGTPGKTTKVALIDNILEMQDKKLKEQIQEEIDTKKEEEEIEKVLDTIDDEKTPEVGLEYGEQSEEDVQREITEISGILDIHADGFGFLRGENYEADPSSDVYVSKNTIRMFRLRKGDFIEGTAEKRREGSPSLKYIRNINGIRFGKRERINFDDLIPYYPEERITLELPDAEDDLSIRCIDILSPIGKGQRGLIVAPPKAGKTTLLKKIAKSIEINYPNIHLIVLLIDERPEEVTDFKRSVSCEVIYSTFDESPEHHIRAADLVINRAKRLVEVGNDVVILLDSITKLSRAFNAVVPSSGRTLSGGIDPAALQAPKKFFGTARNIENGGSLTILSTALVETGSKMDDVIYEEFKGTGNMEIFLSRKMSERRIFPAIDLYKSGTRKDELLLSKEEFDCAYAIRRFLDRDTNALENLLDMVKKTKNNKEFVVKAPIWLKLLMGEK